MNRRMRTRRGLALLLVIVALSIVTAAATGALRASANALSAAHRSVFEVQAEALARDMEPVLLDALREGADALFPIEGDPSAPAALLRTGRGAVRVSVDALDLTGRLHAMHLGSLADAGLPEALQPLSGSRGSLETRRTAHGVESLPLTLEQVIAENGLSPTVGGVRVHPPSLGGLDAAALWITTRGRGALNVRTAPMPLLRAAVRGRDPGAAREVIDAREHGRAIPPDAVVRLSRAPRHGAGAEPRFVPLTATSDAVAFIVTIEAAGRRARWWSVAEPKRAGSVPRVVRALPELNPDPSASNVRRPDQAPAWTIVERRRIE